MGDIMYFYEALKQPDASNLVQAVVKEVNGHVDKKHWEPTKHSSVSKNMEIVPIVWAMCHKHNLNANDITKYKAASKHMASTTLKPMYQ